MGIRFLQISRSVKKGLFFGKFQNTMKHFKYIMKKICREKNKNCFLDFFKCLINKTFFIFLVTMSPKGE